METIKNAANQIGETVQGGASQASKEGNKYVARDSNASLSTRATAAKDAMSDKMDQEKHETKANVYKNKQ